MQRLTRRTILAAGPATLALGGAILSPLPARAAKKYGPGVTDTEIKIGNTGPYSGPLLLYRGQCQASPDHLIPPLSCPSADVSHGALASLRGRHQAAS